MLEIKNVSKRYKLSKGVYETALRGVSTHFSKGEFGLILGESGGGKSTLLNIISGLDTDYEGDVVLNGENLRSINLDRYHRTAVGFVFQNFNLVPHMTVLENVKQSLYLDASLSDRKRTEEAKRLLERVGLGEFLKKKPSQMSGGQKQRIAIARALANNPDIIIADEPTGALDSETSKEIITLLKELSKEGKTVIVVTHDQSLIEYATKVVRLKDGRVDEERVIEECTEDVQAHKMKNSRLSYFISLKQGYMNFMNRKVRNILVAFGTSIGITAILLALGLGNGVNSEMSTILNSAFSPNEVFTYYESAGSGGGPRQPLTKEEVKRIKNLYKKEDITEYYDTVYIRDGVALQYNGKTYDGDQARTVPLEEANRSKDRYENYTVKEDYLLAGKMYDSKSEEGILLKESTLQGLLKLPPNQKVKTSDAKKIIGKKITLVVTYRTENETNTIKQTVPVRGVVKEGASGAFGVELVSTKTFNILHKKMGIDRQVYLVTGYADTPTKGSDFVKKYNAENADKKYPEYKNLSIGNASTLLDSVGQLIDVITIILTFVAGLSLAVAGVMIAIVLYIGVIERTREIGVMRAIGYKRGHIRRLFIIESIYIMLFSNIISILFALGIAKIANPVLEKTLQFEKSILITPQSILITFLITAAIGIIFALYPAIKGSRLDPATSLRYE